MPDTYGAKQVASRIGTDAKTFRKFLRSSASPYVAVGQGSRYEFPVEDLGEIKAAFIKWQSKKRPTPPPTVPMPTVYIHNPLFRGDTPDFTSRVDSNGIDWSEPSDDDIAAIEAGDIDEE